MTNALTTPKFTLPPHMIIAAEVNHSLPQAKRSLKTRNVQAVTPSAELMAELRGLLKQLHPDDPHPDRHCSRVLIAIYFETAGHPDGFAMADAWSRRGRAYKGPARVRKFWKGIKPCPTNPLTIRTLRWMVDRKCEGTNRNEAINNKEK